MGALEIKRELNWNVAVNELSEFIESFVGEFNDDILPEVKVLIAY